MIRLGIRVRAAQAEIAYARLEPVLADGMEEVALGEDVEYAIYGEALPSEAELRALGGDVIVGVTRRVVARDWERAWHEYLGRVVVERVAVRPPWVAGDADDIVIEPGTTFGAASHPTTRLCLALLQELPPTSLADWGSGAGTLAIAAARLGFSPVVALELDPAAVDVARANAVANGVEVAFTVGDVRRDAIWAPTIVANLTAQLLAEAAVAAAAWAAAAAPCVAPGPTRLVASGVLDSQADAAVTAWAPLGFAERERRALDGWAAIVLERA